MVGKIFVLAAAVALCGCGKDESSTGEKGTAATEAPESGEKAPRKKREKKDRGEGSMMLGEIEWLASSARAKFKEDTLKISMSRMDGSVKDKMVRHSLDFHIRDFKGPGEYTIAMHGGMPSLYIVVGFSAPDNDSEEDATKAAMQAFNESKTVMLGGATVTVSSVTDTEVVGPFAHKAAKVPMTQGKFRAVIKKPKK